MKICTTCKIEKDNSCFSPNKSGDGTVYLRSSCKECRRDKISKWRKENPEKQKEIRKKSYINTFEKNKDKLYAKRREKYFSDENYRRKLSDYHSKHWAKKNPKGNCKICGIILPKNHYKFCLECSETEKIKRTKESNERLGKEYINKRQNVRVKNKVDNLTDGYVAGQIRGNNFPGWKLKEIPKEIIEMKRNVLKLKREIKNKQQ